MRIFLTADESWPDPAAILALVTELHPSHVRIDNTSPLKDGLPGLSWELVPGKGARIADVAIRFTDDPAVLPQQADLLPTVVARSRAGSWLERIDAPARSNLRSDLAYVLGVLRGLYRIDGSPKGPIKLAGIACGAAVEKGSDIAVQAAWCEVESVRVAHPRWAPWLITPDRLLCRWFYHLGAEGRN